MSESPSPRVDKAEATNDRTPGMRVGLQALFETCASPIWGHHNPLVLGWSERQLLPIVELLEPYIPSVARRRRQLAIASCARSLFVENMLSGKPLRFPGGQVAYAVPKRYRCGDPLYTYRYVTESIDILERAGLVGQCAGSMSGRRQSVAWPTDTLMQILEQVVDIGEARELRLRDEVIILRDRLNKRKIDYPETATTAKMRAEMEFINSHHCRVVVHAAQDIFRGLRLRRVFVGTMEQGGRLYCKGASYQNIRSAERAQLKIETKGRIDPTVEIDFRAIHITMAYAKENLSLPESDDPYVIEGYDRDRLVKLAVNIVLNARNHQAATHALAKQISGDRTLKEAAGLTGLYIEETELLRFSRELVKAIKAKHHQIKEYFTSDCGVLFQYLDSGIAVQILTRMIHMTGRCPLPVHDSFIVVEQDRELLAQTMQEVARESGFPLGLK